MAIRPRVITAAEAEAAGGVTHNREFESVEATPSGSVATAPLVVVEDTPIAKVVKYIPSEIIALQQLLNGGAEVIGASETGYTVLAWISILLLVLTPFWYAASTRDAGQPVSWPQVVLSTAAFLIWLLAIGSPAGNLFAAWGFPADSLPKGLWSIIFAFFVGVTPMLERIFASR